jgi:DNA-binding NarL/FixJ family response regulator
MANSLAKVVLIDEQTLFRDALREWFQHRLPFVLVGDASDARAGYEMIQKERPDLVLMDGALSNPDGFSATREILSHCKSIRIIILSIAEYPEQALRAVRDGASGYFSKKQSGEELIAAMQAVLDGERYFAAGLPNFAPSTVELEEQARLVTLTPREREIFSLVICGVPNRLIAPKLGISIKTVETHREHINRKMGAHCTADLVRFAARNGLLGVAHPEQPEPRPQG